MLISTDIQVLEGGVLNAYWHQRFRNNEWESLIAMCLVLNAYWHQRFRN